MGAGSDYLGEIAARVGENLDACRLDAFDVKTWMGERLIDILEPTSKTIDSLTRLNVPAGVDISIKL